MKPVNRCSQRAEDNDGLGCCEGNRNRPIGVDLFAGAGGMTLGFEQAGFDVLAAVEYDPIHCATHEFNFPFWSILCRSVADISGTEIRQKSAIGSREIDVVFGGPPCQGFSTMGKRALDDPRNALVRHFVRLVTELQPRYFVMENVKGLTIGKHRQVLEEIVSALEQQGYAVEGRYQVLNAADYGVPQSRQRLFLLGCRQGLSLPRYPKPTTRPALVRRGDLPSGPTVWDAIGDLPNLDEFEELWQQDWTIAPSHKAKSQYGRWLQSTSRDERDFSYPRLYDPKLLTSSLRTRHTPETIERFTRTLPGTTEPISRFFKLDPNGTCNTLRAGTPSSRGAFTSPRPIHPFQPRCISIREAARLHSYPDWFRFHATKWHGCRQIGNSVPPFLARAVAEEILQALGLAPTAPESVYHLGEVSRLNFTMSQASRHYSVSPHTIAPRSRTSI